MMPVEWVQALIGGVWIGLAATLMWLGLGRVAGVSGILAGFFPPRGDKILWRVCFVVGLVAAGVIGDAMMPERFVSTIGGSDLLVAIGGLLVGFGTALSGGCTSGHGVCGISRFSFRSIVATCLFIAAGGLAVKLLGMGT